LLDAKAGPELLTDNAKWGRDRPTRAGVPAAQIADHICVLGTPAAMEAALAWYRARGVRHAPVGSTKVPTLYIWGDQDDTVGRVAADATAECIDAPYRFVPLVGVGHYPADQVPQQLSARLLEHLGRHPDRPRALIKTRQCEAMTMRLARRM
jgi:pimeloyl-ACP methyl ester carboxylesterase